MTVDGRRICVYCGSKPGAGGAYSQEARALGAGIARRGMGMVYGGGNCGLMGLVADAVMAAGGDVVGVIPRGMNDRELAHTGLAELIVVDGMHERKAIMAARSHAFVALPGGYGTMEELFEAAAWAQLEIHDKPIGLLNTAGYFDHLLAFLDHAVSEEFLRPRHRDLLHVESEPGALLAALVDAMD